MCFMAEWEWKKFEDSIVALGIDGRLLQYDGMHYEAYDVQ